MIKTRTTAHEPQKTFAWEGRDSAGKLMRGEMLAPRDIVVRATLRKKGIRLTQVVLKKQKRSKAIKNKDITILTRQLATMMQAGVPLLQAFDIVIRSATKTSTRALLTSLRTHVESGLSLHEAFSRHPKYFNALFCNLVSAGEQSGKLDLLMDKLASYREKMQAIKSKIRSALMYPTIVVIAAISLILLLMLFMVPSFKKVFENFNAPLPDLTLAVMAASDFVVNYWMVIVGGLVGGILAFSKALKHSVRFRGGVDQIMLRLPIFGPMLTKAIIARWTSTLSILFAAGVPLVDALESSGKAADNTVYRLATKKIRAQVSTGLSLTAAMENTGIFPNMATQMVAIGEESGALETLLTKVANTYEAEVNDLVSGLSSLLEPIIIVFLGTIILGVMLSVYLPIFNMGAIV